MRKPRRLRSRRTSLISEFSLIKSSFWQAADSAQLSRPQHVVDDPRCQGDLIALCAFLLPLAGSDPASPKAATAPRTIPRRTDGRLPGIACVAAPDIKKG